MNIHEVFSAALGPTPRKRPEMGKRARLLVARCKALPHRVTMERKGTGWLLMPAYDPRKPEGEECGPLGGNRWCRTLADVEQAVAVACQDCDDWAPDSCAVCGRPARPSPA